MLVSIFLTMKATILDTHGSMSVCCSPKKSWEKWNGTISRDIILHGRCQFHQHYTRAFCQSKSVTRNITREKLPNQCSYEKFLRIKLMKLTPDVYWCCQKKRKEEKKMKEHKLLQTGWRDLFQIKLQKTITRTSKTNTVLCF